MLAKSRRSPTKYNFLQTLHPAILFTGSKSCAIEIETRSLLLSPALEDVKEITVYHSTQFSRHSDLANIYVLFLLSSSATSVLDKGLGANDKQTLKLAKAKAYIKLLVRTSSQGQSDPLLEQSRFHTPCQSVPAFTEFQSFHNFDGEFVLRCGESRTIDNMMSFVEAIATPIIQGP